jgi:hypothetical protein
VPRLEILNCKFIYSNGVIGAAIMANGKWCPFRYFDDGGRDYCDEEFDTKEDAYKFAESYFT